ncbi:hypothetical protein [Streptosporangium sp. NBC_01756]|uniref:hypothetical protein n=1 Tax=Streptosporangium sp. NBC_01756 TaxID=2975950 RepID=UPI002DD79EB2|nr:hypothetical protein [Streptosporangium sp. NBC_01756]WSC83727.1 hypothetical protein OIE48_25365 [Streptosporangium sp. NBC_01756]
MDALGVTVPTYSEARLESEEFTDCTPTEYRADAVVMLTLADEPALAVVVEVQRGQDKDKRWSWPVYLATLRARTRCPTVLLVICTNTRTAMWCATPIPLGHPGWTLAPLVIGPEAVPMVTDAKEAARTPELAVLSAMAHGGAPEGADVLRALFGALDALDDDQARLYSDFVLMALPPAARLSLELMMETGTYEYQSDFARKYVAEGREEGRAEGETKALLAVLSARGIDVSDDARERITNCTDIDQIEAWIRLAATANSTDVLFG